MLTWQNICNSKVQSTENGERNGSTPDGLCQTHMTDIRGQQMNVQLIFRKFMSSQMDHYEFNTGLQFHLWVSFGDWWPSLCSTVWGTGLVLKSLIVWVISFFISKHNFIFSCCSFITNVIFLSENDPMQWMCSLCYGYWWPGALASGHN